MGLILHLSDEETAKLREFVYTCFESRDARVLDSVGWFSELVEREEAACLKGSATTLDKREFLFISFAREFKKRVGRCPSQGEIRKALKLQRSNGTYYRLITRLQQKRLLRVFRVPTGQKLRWSYELN